MRQPIAVKLGSAGVSPACGRDARVPNSQPRFGGLLIALALVLPVHAAPNIVPDAPPVSSKSYILMDAGSGSVMAERDGDAPLPPASLTKIMTSFVAASELAAGRITLDDDVPISVKAWRTGGSKMFVREGTFVKLEDLLRGIVIQSGNDASVAVAEYIGGDEEGFANMMNATWTTSPASASPPSSRSTASTPTPTPKWPG